MAEEAKKKTRKPRPRPTQAIQFTVWSANGGPVPDKVIQKIEDAIQGVTLEVFNDGHRILTQTIRG